MKGVTKVMICLASIKKYLRSLMGSRRPDVADSVTKRRSQMGLTDTDSASNTSLKKLWDNGGDIAS